MGERRAQGARWDFLCIRGISTEKFAHSPPGDGDLVKVLKPDIKQPVMLQK